MQAPDQLKRALWHHPMLIWGRLLVAARRRLALRVATLSCLASLLALLQPWLSKVLVDDGALAGDLGVLASTAALMLLVPLLGLAVEAVTRFDYLELSSHVLFGLRERVFAHLQSLSPVYYSRVGFGDLVARFDGDLAEVQRFLFEAQHKRFDLAIQLHGSGALSNPITASLGALQHAGFFLPGAYCPDPNLFLPWKEGEHEVARYLSLLRFLGARADDASLEFPLREADYQSLAASGPLPPPGSYVCVHAGARDASLRWPGARVARVADALAGEGWHVVITGSAFERPVIDELLKHTSAPMIDMSGRTTLGALAALLAGARMVLCNDSGVSHLAAALATPSVVPCCASDPARWAPERARQPVLQADTPCRPCAGARCPPGRGCADKVSVEQVLAEALDMCARSSWERSVAQ